MPPIASNQASHSQLPPSDSLTSCTVRAWSEMQDDDLVDVPDPDFHDFDAARTEQSVKPGQVWAFYDDKDGMPRFYGRIRSVSVSPFTVHFCWLVPHQSSEECKLWTTSTGFCLTTGQFEDGEPAVSTVINMFSHRISAKAENKRGRDANTALKIHPKKGDVWAMYTDWDQVKVKARTQAPSDVRCTYHMVEVLNDYCKESCVKTVKLIKLQGFRTVFHRQDDSQAHIWNASDLLRFSHSVPAQKLRPDKLIGIPKQAWELDPAAVPLGVEEPEPVQESGDMETKSQLLNESGVMELGTSQHETKELVPPFNSVQETRGMEVDATDPTGQPGVVDSSSPATAAGAASKSFPSSKLRVRRNLKTIPDSDFYDFSSLRTEADVEVGQIWAIYDDVDRMPRCYVRVTRVSVSPSKVEVWRLKPQPCSATMKSWMDRTGLSLACSDFEDDKSDVLGLQNFSHVVLSGANKCVKIYPRKGEVWATYRNQESLGTKKRKKKHSSNAYELLEILDEHLEEKSLKVVILVKVKGFKTLFQRQGTPFTIKIVGPESLFEFSHSIPARRMYKDDTLRIPLGAVELDPACTP